MKIYYFSGTGNSLYIAKEVAKRLEGVELVSITSCMDKHLVLEGEVGIAFPLYAFGLPKMVKRFLQKTDFSKVVYFFGLQTRGGSPGHAFADAQRLAGRKFDASFKVNMPNAYLPLGDVYPEEKTQTVLQKAEGKIDKIVEVLSARRKHNEGDFFLLKLVSVPAYWVWAKFSDLGKKYFVDDSCNGCGLCNEICPSGCIQMKEGKPIWQSGKCESCMACINYCPVQSIQLNEKTRKFGRYHHPDIKWELIADKS